MARSSPVLGRPLRDLAVELAGIYAQGHLAIVTGAGVSRAAGLPAWRELVGELQQRYLAMAGSKALSAERLDAVLAAVHGPDVVGRADSLRRAMKAKQFTQALHASLYPDAATGNTYEPSVIHFHIASLMHPRAMPEVFTANYDDLLEDAKKCLRVGGRVRHFHGRLPQRWTGNANLGDVPVITTRDYLSAEQHGRYDRLAVTLSRKTVLLVGMSLVDPNLIKLINESAADCRALVVAYRDDLSLPEQQFRLMLLERYYRGLGIETVAIQAYEEVPAFLLELRRQVAILANTTLSQKGVAAFRSGARRVPTDWKASGTWPVRKEWRDALRRAVIAAKGFVPGLSKDPSLRAGLYLIDENELLTHAVDSSCKRSDASDRVQRQLKADALAPWGVAGYAFAAGVTAVSSVSGASFDRNVPDTELLAWQSERANERRLPASSVLCSPAWVRNKRQLIAVGTLYLASRRSNAFALDPESIQQLEAVLRGTFESMLRPSAVARV